LLLAVGEGIANAIEHAYRSAAREEVSADICVVDQGRVVGLVLDYGSWRERRRPTQVQSPR